MKATPSRSLIFCATLYPLGPGLEIQGEIEPGELQSTTAQGGWEHLHPDTEKGNKDNLEPKPKHCHTQVYAFGESAIEAETLTTVGQLIQKTVMRFPFNTALKYKEDGTWKAISYNGYYDFCIRAAKSLLEVRVGR